jgi:transcriptional regulator with XRE-family HTH domain
MAKAAARKVVREDPVSRAFGDRVRVLREQADLTLEQLSKQSGVSRAMLSKVERGEKSPTIGVARRIALALGTSFSALMGDDDAPRRAFAVVRKDQRQIFRDAKTGFERFLLSPVMAGMAVEVVLHRLPPKTSTGSLPAYPVGTSKHVLATQGKVTVRTKDTETLLEEGDSLYFEVDVEHWFENRTARVCEYYLVISATPSFGRRGDGKG